jgi:DNA replication protein DnaC
MTTANTPSVPNRLHFYLKELMLPTIRECYPEVVRQATNETLSYEQFLLELLTRESEVRGQHRVQRRLHESRLPLEKNLAAFDRGRLSEKVKQQFAALQDGAFLDRRENVLAFGNPGSGKTHLLCALCQELVHRDRRVLYTTCSLLVQELLLAKRDLRLAATLKRLGKYEALLIDDLGYVQQSREEMEVLFTLLADRYERGSVLITSNLPFSQWEAIFKDPLTTAAAIDRLVHHSVILELNLASYRMEAAKQRQRPASAGRAARGKEERPASEPVTLQDPEAR